MAQPLYMPNVNIPGQGTHNVVYVVTQADSVYAIDADNGAQLWYTSILNGGTTASGIYLPCGTGPGYNQEGIVSTPVIDPTTNTMYLVAKTVLNATVRHQLHALDISTGNEQPGSPVLITATSTSNAGHLTVFNSKPDYGLTSIWQAGVGLAADAAGNIFVETAEAGGNGFDVPSGGQTYCNSVLKLSPDLTVADYFTPWSVAYLNSHDLDLSSTGALILPDQDGPYPHELIAGGKQGIA